MQYSWQISEYLEITATSAKHRRRRRRDGAGLPLPRSPTKDPLGAAEIKTLQGNVRWPLPIPQSIRGVDGSDKLIVLMAL